MSDSSPPRLTPGRLTALWLVLASVKRLGGYSRKDEALALASRSALRSGGLPVRDGLQLAREGGFLEGDEEVRLTALGMEALSRTSEAEPNTDVLRLFISVLMLKAPPLWVAYWQGDPGALPLVLDDGQKELLKLAELSERTSTDDLEAWAWWDALRTLPPASVTAAARKAIGDAAEELSFLYERQRLENEGYPELARRVRWVARESPAYGFDLLSFNGAGKLGAADAKIAIEVKAMARLAADNFTLFLTIHEYETSVVLADRYILHLWDGVQGPPAIRAASAAPVVAESAQLRVHLPSSPICGGVCSWESTFASLPLSDLVRVL